MEKKAEPKADAEFSGVTAPTTINCDFERKPLLFLPSGKALVRTAGFTNQQIVLPKDRK